MTNRLKIASLTGGNRPSCSTDTTQTRSARTACSDSDMRDPVRAYLQVLRLAYFRFVSVTWQAMNLFLENGLA